MRCSCRNFEVSLLLFWQLCAVSGCSSGSEDLQLPNSETEFREFLQTLVKLGDEEIHKMNSEFARKNERGPINGDGFNVLPMRVSIAEDGLGLDWKRVIYQDSTPEQNAALKALYGEGLPLEHLEEYCKTPITDWMEKFGYHVRERLYARGGELISDHFIDISSCLEYEKLLVEFEMDGFGSEK